MIQKKLPWRNGMRTLCTSLFGFYLSLSWIPSSSNASEDYRKVFVQCAVAQGNGFNWAATIGWLAGTVRQLADKASELESKHATRAGVDVSCFTGSSSSGFSAAL